VSPAKYIKLPVTGPQALSMSELARWYCYNTNTHGFRRIVVSRGRLRRGAWVLLTGCAASLIVWQCALLASAYYTVSVSITVHFQELPFPAITICNINPYRSACPTLTGPALATLAGPALVGPAHARPAHARLSEVIRRYIKCKVLTCVRVCVNVFVSACCVCVSACVCCPHSPHGQCEGGDIDSSDCTIYTFTSGMAAVQEWYQLHYYNLLAQVPPEDKRAMGYSADDLFLTCLYDGLPCDSRNFSLHQHPLHGNCFTFNGGENGRVLITRTGGSQNGLKVTLHLDEDEYNPYLVTSTGAKIVVHDQSEHPFVEDLGIAIPAGMETSIGLDLMCLHSCFQKEMVQTCGCGHYEKPLPPGAQYCDYNRFPGWSESVPSLSLYPMHTPPPQTHVTLSLILLFPPPQQDWTSLWLQMVTLLSNFGGQLGLWMSCSVICVIEIVEVLLVDALWVLVRSAGQRVRRWWQRPEQEEVPAHGTAHGITVYLEDEDPPTFNAALRLPRQCPPTAPPPNYEMLRALPIFLTPSAESLPSSWSRQPGL
uniref:Sodium channel epithelial 1 subunit gamma n=1 Tax=Callorhinchus milii TaxID=7868 RepID=A0A4W3IVX8_CALMI